MIRLVIALVLASATAHANPVTAHANPADAVEIHVTTAGEIMLGPDTAAFGFRGQFLLGKSIDKPLWKRDTWGRKISEIRPAFAIGATVGAGALNWTDAAGGPAWGGYRNIGVVAQVALRLVNGGRIDDRVFASFSVLRATGDQPMTAPHVGLRASLGTSLANRAYHLKTGDNIGVVIPHALEVVYERDAGANRFGFLFGYGI